jgi:hypothetical protein
MSAGTVGGTLIGGNSLSGGTASGNSVTLSGGTVTGDIYGGATGVTGSESGGIASNNVVTVSGGSVNDIIGGRVRRDSNNATGNEVIITGGTISGYVQGGNADVGSATGNTVIISGGNFTGTDMHIYGGYAEGAAGNEVTTGNTVEISGSPQFNHTTNIQGGSNLTDYGGNTLITRTTGLTVNGVGAFDTYEFILPANSVGGTVYAVNSPVNLAGTTVYVTLEGGRTLREGESVTLFNQTTGAPATSSATITGGVSLLYEGGLNVTGNSLVLTVNSVQLNPQIMAFSQAALARGIAANVAADFLSEQGILAATLVLDQLAIAPVASASGLASLASPRRGGPAVFAAIGGGTSRYDLSGNSRLRVNSLPFLLGLANRLDTEDGRLTFAGFLEGGYGNYRGTMGGLRYNDRDGFHYAGVGLLGRYESIGGFYAEAAGHLGGVKQDFTATPAFAGPLAVNYSSDSLYYGILMGVGFRQSFASTQLDLSAKYLWNQADGDRTEVAGDPYEFDRVNSQRLRLAARLLFRPECFVSPYAGAAFEYEGDGSSSGSVYGFALPEASLKGGTVFAEGGVRLGGGGNYGFDLGLKGYLGRRQGVSGAIRFETRF